MKSVIVAYSVAFATLIIWLILTLLSALGWIDGLIAQIAACLALVACSVALVTMFVSTR